MTTAQAEAKNLVNESDATSIEIQHALHVSYRGYWWDHTNLTAAVQAAPNVDPTLLQAAHDALATWSAVIEEQFDGVITLSNVTDTSRTVQEADIVLHYVPTAGGVVFSGYARCGAHSCPNVLVRSHAPMYDYIYSYDLLYAITLHEAGHALGLGHAQPLETTNDLMGYGWIPDVLQGAAPPGVSFCDIEGLEEVFAWALEDAAPYPPTVATVACGPDN